MSKVRQSNSLLRVAINTEIKGKADLQSDPRARHSLTHNFNVRDLPLEEFAVHIKARHNFTAVCLDESEQFHRCKEHFKSSDLLPLDFDNSKDTLVESEKGKIEKIKVKCDATDYVTLDEIRAHPIVKHYAALIYTTASHTEDWHRFRVVFWLPLRVTSLVKFERLLDAFIWLFKSDKSCSDASRFFYGSGPDGQVEVLGNRSTEECLISLLKGYKVTRVTKRKQVKARPNSNKSMSGSQHSSPPLPDSELMTLAMNAANGQKFENLWDGNISDYSSASEADLAFCMVLAFWTQDATQVERLWKQSKLSRDKLLARSDYVEKTIKKALELQEDHYSPGNSNHQNGAEENEAAEQYLDRIEKAASALDDIILLMTATWRWAEEDKLTLLALFSIFGGRKTARVSRATLAGRIREREDSKSDNTKAESQFGGRRLTSLRKTLRQTVNYPILILREQGGTRAGFNRKTGKPNSSRWELDMTPFREALALSQIYLREWDNGQPRFDEWQSKKPHPGLARAKAATILAREYHRGKMASATPNEAQLKTGTDAYSKWIRGEHTMIRAAAHIADSWEDLSQTTAENRFQAKRILAQTEEILLQKDKAQRRRKLQEIQEDTRRANS